MESMRNKIKSKHFLFIFFLCLYGSHPLSGQFFQHNQLKIEDNPHKFPDSLRIEFVTSQFSQKKQAYLDIHHVKKIDPTKSAIVIIDVWEETFLDSLVINIINPLIVEANSLGIKVIYAPSQQKQNHDLKIIEDGVTFFNLDVMDEYITHNKIENLFYVGFDALYCVIDKPNGIFSFKDRKLNLYVFEIGVTSYTREMKETAISLFKKHEIGIIYSDYMKFDIPYPKQTINNLNEITSNEINDGNNFILIFKEHYPYVEHNVQALDSLEKGLIKNNYLFAVIENDILYFNNKTLHCTYELIQLLESLKIDNIYYCGYYLNKEMLWSNFGITNLYIKKRYYSVNFIPDIFIINDLSYVAESSALDPSIEKSVIINHYRGVKNIMSYTLFDDKVATKKSIRDVN